MASSLAAPGCTAAGSQCGYATAINSLVAGSPASTLYAVAASAPSVVAFLTPLLTSYQGVATALQGLNAQVNTPALAKVQAAYMGAIRAGMKACDDNTTQINVWGQNIAAQTTAMTVAAAALASRLALMA
jgi:hypothetical protein